MRRCVIVGGASIRAYDRIRPLLRDDDYFIYCDGGLKHRDALGKAPDLIVGDFDSWENPHEQTETIVLPREKDDTDTIFAAKEAIKRGYTDYLLIGVVGERFDHTMGNIGLLMMLNDKGYNAELADDHSLMRVVNRQRVRVDDGYSYFSILAVGGNAEGVTVRNAKYEVEDVVMTCEYPYGISNEPIKGVEAEITVRSGKLLLIMVH